MTYAQQMGIKVFEFVTPYPTKPNLGISQWWYRNSKECTYRMETEPMIANKNEPHVIGIWRVKSWKK